MNASGRTLFLKTGLVGAGLLMLTAIPVRLSAQKGATAVNLPAQKTKSSGPAIVAVIPAPPILHNGVVQQAGSAANADDVHQDPSDPTHAHNATTGQDLAWDADKKSWVESKSGQALGFSGMQSADGSIIPAPPALHNGVVQPVADGMNARVGADDVHQYESDPDHAYDRTTHRSLYWDAKRGSWVDVMSGHNLGFDGAPIASPASMAVAIQPKPMAPAPAQAAAAPAAAQAAAAPAAQPAAQPEAAATHGDAAFGPRPAYNSDFTLGWAGGATWTKATGSTQTITSISIPSQQYLMQWNAARRLSLGLYLGGTYLKQSSVAGSGTAGPSATLVNVGVEPDIYFFGRDRANDVRLFVGPGLWYNYTNVSGPSAAGSVHQLAASGMLGAEVPIWREGRMRVGLEYGHDFQNTTDNLAAANFYSFDLGLMFDAPSGLQDNYADYQDLGLPAFSIRYGSSLGFSSFGTLSGASTPNQLTVALPAATFGGYGGIGSTKQLRVGSELDYTRLSGGGASVSYLDLEPGVEYYLMPHAYKGWDVRFRGFGVLEYESASAAGGGYSASANDWLSGYGVEAMLTHHFFGPQLVGFGLSYTHLGEDMTLAVPSQNTINLKFTIDSRLF